MEGKIYKEADQEDLGYMKKSWKTTAGGVALILGALAQVVPPLLDNDPSTVANWEIAYTQIAAGIALLFARDNKVTSEEANAKR